MIDFALEHPRCALFAAMGSGKTVSVLTVIAILVTAGAITGPVLIAAPLRVANNVWPGEVEKWDHLRGTVIEAITGSVTRRQQVLDRALRPGDCGIYTINYDNLPWLLDYVGGRWPFQMVVADESTRLKSFRLRQGSKRAQALARAAHSRVKRWINLSGTPTPNGLQDLWGQTWFVDKGERLGKSFSAFSSRWFATNHNGFGLRALPHAQAEIEARLKDICLTINPADYFPVDKPTFVTVPVELPGKVMKLYRQFEREMFIELEGQPIEAFNAAAKSTKCLQLANGAMYTDDKGSWVEAHDAKLQALESIVNEAAGAPLLVAYQFKSDLARIRKAFPQARVLDDRKQTEDDWNAGRIPMLLAHPASAGHGLNLQDGGNMLAFFGQSWDLELYEQMIERIGPLRQLQSGHPRPVIIYNIVAADTLDEAVVARRESKCSLQEAFLQAMKRRPA